VLIDEIQKKAMVVIGPPEYKTSIPFSQGKDTMLVLKTCKGQVIGLLLIY